MKAIWKGSVAFGLINIPINVYPASEEHVLPFHMLHKKDRAPIQFSRICKEEGKEVPYSEIIKGYEFAKGQYVVVTEEDFKAANAKKASTIEIQHFTDIGEIDPIYFAKPYYLEADKKSHKAYQLLHRGLQKSNRVAIVRFVFRNKEHLGIIIPSKGALLLIQMRYHTEIRPFQFGAKEKISERELNMALALIDQLTEPFDPEKYHDTYTEELMGVIEQKLKGKKVVKKEHKISRGHAAKDLMALLKQSLEETPSPKKRQVAFKQAKKRAA